MPTMWSVVAVGPPLRFAVCPVKTRSVDVPPVSVIVSVTSYGPWGRETGETRGPLDGAGQPATKARPPSGAIAIAVGWLTTAKAGAVMKLASDSGVIVLSSRLVTNAVVPSGVIAIALGWPPTGIGVPLVHDTIVMGVTVSSPA